MYERLASYFGAFPFDSCFEIHLQSGSIFCICRSVSNLSADKDFGVVLCVSSDVLCCYICLRCGIFRWTVVSCLTPSVKCRSIRVGADSILIVAGLFGGNSTRCERQSAALLWAQDIHLKVMLYVASSPIPICWLCVFAFSIKKSCQCFVVIAYYYFSSLKAIIPFLWLHNIHHRLPILWCSISIECQWNVWKESYSEFCFIMFLG